MKKTLRHITINNTIYNYITSDFSLKVFHGNNKNEYVKVNFDLEKEKYPDALIFLGHFRIFQNGKK